MYAIRHKLPPP